MALIIIVFWLLAALLSFFAKSKVLLLLCSSFLAFFALLLVRDLSVLKQRLALFLGQELGTEVVTAQGNHLCSGIASAISPMLEALTYKLNTLSWKLRNDSRQNQAARISNARAPTDKLAQRLQDLAAQFRCKAAAILVCEKHDKQNQLRIIVSGFKGNQRRLERHLTSIYQSYFKAHNEENLGLNDMGLAGSALASLTLFGLRYSIAQPLSDFEQKRAWSGILWLGYDSASVPLEEELTEAKSKAIQLGCELDSILALEDLVKKVQAAQSNEKSKDDFITQVSHDIRSPLNNIRAILNVLRLENLVSDSDEMLQVALQNCESLSELVGDILDFSRHRAGKLAAKPEVFDLTALTLEVFEAFKVSAKLKNIELSFENLPAGCNVSADRRQIKRVLQNVLGNAVKFTNSGGVRVQIIRATNSHFSVLVRDSGCGIKPQQLQSLFVPFHEQDAASLEYDGVGLGLALSKVLIELNSGSINLQSQFGKGSLFELNIPAAGNVQESMLEVGTVATLRNNFFDSQKEAVMEKTVKLQSPIGIAARWQIMLVDDDSDCVNSLARVLSSDGVDVIKAYSASDAISILNFANVDFVLCDASMPDGGARRVLQYMRSKDKSTPLVILSGHDDQAIRAQFIALGAADLWLKPLDLEKFRCGCSKLLLQRGLEKVA